VRLPASGEIRREFVEESVELLAATAILCLSVGCGLAAARLGLEGLFSLMTLHSPLHHVSPVPLAIELPYETQLRLATPAA
jgi:hypothetical protein